MSQRLVAVCGDDPLPAEGAAFGACSAVVWVSDLNATRDLTSEELAELFPATAGFLAMCFVWRLLRKVF